MVQTQWSNQNRYLHKALDLAREIQGRNPEIAQMYREGKTSTDIAEHLASSYELDKEILRIAVFSALRGFRSDALPQESFLGLLPISEYKPIAMRNKKEVARRNSLSAREKGIGIHSPEVREMASRKGLLKLGRNLYAPRQAYFNFDGSGFVRTGTRLSEKEYLFLLAGKPEFQHSEGSNKGRPNFQLITKEINRVYHDGRDVRKATLLSNLIYESRNN